jgi:hypothetical protein
MNLMTLQRYKNEIILLITLLFAIFAFFYKLSANTYVAENKENIQKTTSEIRAIDAYKSQWDGKSMGGKVKIFKTLVEASKVKSFTKKAKKLVASYEDLTANELNKINNKLLNIPVQIVHLKVTESSKNKFSMEFTCKW